MGIRARVGELLRCTVAPENYERVKQGLAAGDERFDMSCTSESQVVTGKVERVGESPDVFIRITEVKEIQ